MTFTTYRHTSQQWRLGDSNDVVTRRVRGSWLDRDIGHRDSLRKIVEIPVIPAELTNCQQGGWSSERAHSHAGKQ